MRRSSACSCPGAHITVTAGPVQADGWNWCQHTSGGWSVCEPLINLQGTSILVGVADGPAPAPAPVAAAPAAAPPARPPRPRPRRRRLRRAPRPARAPGCRRRSACRSPAARRSSPARPSASRPRRPRPPAGRRQSNTRAVHRRQHDADPDHGPTAAPARASTRSALGDGRVDGGWHANPHGAHPHRVAGAATRPGRPGAGRSGAGRPGRPSAPGQVSQGRSRPARWGPAPGLLTPTPPGRRFYPASVGRVGRHVGRAGRALQSARGCQLLRLAMPSECRPSADRGPIPGGRGAVERWAWPSARRAAGRGPCVQLAGRYVSRTSGANSSSIDTTRLASPCSWT